MERERRGSLRTVTAIVLFVCAVALLGNAIVALWPSSNGMQTTQLRTSRDLVLAYSQIRPGLTHASELAQYGFDSTSKGTKLLSYLAVMESFVPHDSKKFDQLAPAIQDCVAARERCTALIFQPADYTDPPGSPGLFKAFGMGADAASRAPQVTLFVRDGRVTFKMISGIEEHPSRSDRVAREVPIPFRLND